MKHSPYCTIGKIQRDFLADERTRPFHGYTFRHTFAVAFNERALNMVSIVDAQRMYELLFIQTNYPRSRHRYENHLFWRVRRSRKRTSEQTSVEIVNRTRNRFISAQLNLEKVRYSKPGNRRGLESRQTEIGTMFDQTRQERPSNQAIE